MLGAVAPSSAVDIFNATSNSWSIAHISQARGGLSAASVQGLAIFAGGDSTSSCHVC
jgi:hypothetical protein